MRNKDKSILVTYLDVEKFRPDRAYEYMREADYHIRRQFNPQEKDGSMVFLTFPSDHTEVKLFRLNDLNVTDEEILEVQEKIREMLNKE